MQHKTLSSDRGTLHYWIDGEGDEAILFTHGATLDHDLYRYQMEHFAADYRVITWDVPLHGRSRPYESFSLTGAADELVRILDAEGLDSAHLVGQSMGGYIGQAVAMAWPDRVRTLTMVGSAPIRPSYHSRLNRLLLSIMMPIMGLYPHAVLVSVMTRLYARPGPSRDYVRQTLNRLTRGEIARITRLVYEGLSSFEADTPLPHPLLITHGEADRAANVRSYSRRWAEREGRELRIIPDAAHNANMDNPAAFNRILEDFLRREAGTTPSATRSAAAAPPGRP
jgi:pimeloyl-ACP methyl ester carboxylesterase